MNEGADAASLSEWARGPAAPAILIATSLFKLLLHLSTANRYGYFRDELYFLDCGRNLAWGYVDHAPLIGVIARVALLLGGSLPVVRGIAALAGAALVAVSVLIARELGGNRFAQAFAGLAVTAAPIILGIGSILSMNVFEALIWTSAILVILRIERTGQSRLWLLFGVLCGVGLMNKHSTLFFGAAILVSIVLTPLRRELLKPWIWIGGAIAFAIFAPNLIWQYLHGFPTLEDLANVKRSGKNVILSPGAFITEQILSLHPFLFPIWFWGLLSLLAGRLKQARFAGIAYVTLLLTMMAMHGKTYYVTPMYPMLFAAGAVAIERAINGDGAHRRSLLRGTLLALVIVIALSDVLLVLPILPPEKILRVHQRLGLAPQKTEVNHEGPLEQRLSDQFGWPELVSDVSTAYHSLPPEIRAQTGIFASNYGEAGALHLFGPQYGLPHAVSAHQTHYFWGTNGFQGTNLIWLQWDRADLEPYCTSVVQVGSHTHPWGMAEENGPIFLCRGLKRPLTEIWPELKHWN